VKDEVGSRSTDVNWQRCTATDRAVSAVYAMHALSRSQRSGMLSQHNTAM